MVKLTCYVVYGSYSGNVVVMMPEDWDMPFLEARVRRQCDLTFLSMATYHVKVLKSEPIIYED